jgi:hypothetical protein
MRISRPRLAGPLAVAFVFLLTASAVSNTMLGHQFVPVFSLYVFPARRASGFAYRTLRAVHRASIAAGFTGVRLATHWTWQAAVRRYVFRYGMWAWSFKRSLDFVWASDLPSYDVDVDDHGARFAVDHDGRSLELLTASRDGDRLALCWDLVPVVNEEVGGLRPDRRVLVLFDLQPSIAVRHAALADELHGLVREECIEGGRETIEVKLAATLLTELLVDVTHLHDIPQLAVHTGGNDAAAFAQT